MKTRTAIEAGGKAMSRIGWLNGTFIGRFAVQLEQYCSSLSHERLGYGALGFWTLTGSLAFQAAYALPQPAFLVVVYLFSLIQLSRAETWRGAFYSGLAVGLLAGAPRLAFFWTIFSGGALALWLVYAFWIGLFAALTRATLRRLGPTWGWLVVPFLWVGLEYFRSELYYLKFAWLSPAYAFSEMPWQVPLSVTGVYGLGFVLATVAVVANLPRTRALRVIALVFGTAAIWGWALTCGARKESSGGGQVHVAGVQMEFPTEKEVQLRLTQLLRRHPKTELFVLSEYTFAEPVPVKVRDWCRKNERYLIVGGKAPAPEGQFYNTAFVIGPNGEDVFRQVKGVPIQFFKDGLPAPYQRVWQSPWGRIGICICYDLSYKRIVDPLIQQGAEAIIVPTMDVVDWGLEQHKLHARVAPLRAAEYRVPIFRVASSGISQFVDSRGSVLASAPCPGDGAEMTGLLKMGIAGRFPADHWLAPACVALTAVCGCWLTGMALREKVHPNWTTVAA
jgi:apolipoprotein N-acyltransferase